MKGKKMHWTVFDSPVARTLLRWISLSALKVLGWRVEGRIPDVPKCVMIAAPHTSNWDFVYTLYVSFALRMKVSLMGKKELFRFPFGPVFRWLGVIPVDRSRSSNTVARMARLFAENETLILIVPPSGTRKKVMYWKSGFYHIAREAGVPIALGFLDYGRKAGGIGPLLWPTGNIEADMGLIRSFYADICGKYPEKTIEAPVMAAFP